MYDRYPFERMSLPYPEDALEPCLDAETVRLHHGKHLQSYIDNLNRVLQNHTGCQSWPLERLIANCWMLPRSIQTAVRNNAGGIYNHNLYFSGMNSGCNPFPGGKLGGTIYRCFGSFEAFKRQFKKSAMEQFGSGYTWLALDRSGRLRIVNTPNQNTILPMELSPILTLDIWEHAYYLRYQNRRADYVDAWWNLVDWNVAESRFSEHC